MDPAHARHDILDSRLARLRRTIAGVEARQPAAVHRARTATRRLREVVPLLGLDKGRTRKLARRLRKAGRRLGRVRDIDTQAALIDRLLRLDPSASRVLRQLRADLSRDAARQWHAVPAAHVAARLRRIVAQFTHVAAAQSGPSAAAARTLRWATEARVARRAREAREAIRRAGAMYEPERLHGVRIAVKKLRYALEVAADAGAAVPAADVALVKRVQDVLGHQRDAQILLDRVRAADRTQADRSTVAARDTARVLALLDTRCRRLHARYLRDLDALLTVCTGRGTATAAPVSRRRAG